MILKAKHNIIIDPIVRHFVIWKMKRMFYSVSVESEVHENYLPVLLICNHVGWWDGIWALHINNQLFKRRYHFMMLEEQLRKNWFFNYSGGYSVKKNSKSVVESLLYSAELLQNNKNLVLMFPQGELQSIYNNEFVFEKGVEKILKKVTNKIQVVMLVNLIEYFEHPKPRLFSYVSEFKGANSTNDLQNQYNNFYQKCLGRHKKMKV